MSNQLKIVKVIKPGLLIRDEKGVILDARSTVTLVKSSRNNILIDTSIKKDREALLKGLDAQNRSPDDINIIVNTHAHQDHTQNNAIFPSARIYTHHINKHIRKSVKIKTFPFSLEEKVEIIETPGHSWDSITVIAKKDLIYAITGDAIPIKGNYIDWIPPIVHVDANLALESMAKIVKIADIIIPGHDMLFTIKKPEKPIE